MKVIYINGFNGGGPSAKIDALEEAFPGNVIHEYVPARAVEARDAIYKTISKIDPVEEIVFVGTSLGGFWSAHFSHILAEKAVLLNPCLQPSVLLRKYIGQEVDGRIWTEEDCDAYWALEPALMNDGIPRIVLCEENDEVIPYQSVKEHLNLAGYYHAKFVVLPGGNHRFSNYPEMIAAIDELHFQEVC